MDASSKHGHNFGKHRNNNNTDGTILNSSNEGCGLNYVTTGADGEGDQQDFGGVDRNLQGKDPSSRQYQQKMLASNQLQNNSGIGVQRSQLGGRNSFFANKEKLKTQM